MHQTLVWNALNIDILLFIVNSIANISFYALIRPKWNFGGHLTFESTFKTREFCPLFDQIESFDRWLHQFFVYVLLLLYVKILGHCVSNYWWRIEAFSFGWTKSWSNLTFIFSLSIGRWQPPYEPHTAPLEWSGSVAILEKLFNNQP